MRMGPLEQEQIDAARDCVEGMAKDAKYAIDELKANPQAGQFSGSADRRDLASLNDSAGRLTRSLDEYFQLTRLRVKKDRLEKDLGISTD